MPKGIRYCKICGSAYEYCRTAITGPEMFRWQDVACCPEHGAQYFERVMEARGQKPAEAPAQQEPEAAKAETKQRSRKKKTAAADPAADEEMA